MLQKNIAINGLGRIGRNVFRQYFSAKYSHYKLVAINLGEKNIKSKIHLLEYDSIYGKTHKIDIISDHEILVKNHKIALLSTNAITEINWNTYKVDIVLECTGQFNKRHLAYQHIKQGAQKVLISAPCENADITVVLGVNEHLIKSDDQIISMGSCTTNCLAPIIKTVDQNCIIKNGFVTTIHSYTNDQNLMDSGHEDIRRSRSAIMSMIPTTTGAAKTIVNIMPHLKDRLLVSAIRIPTYSVSMIDCIFNVQKPVNSSYLNSLFEKQATRGPYPILSVNKLPLVSIDYQNRPESTIIDLCETKVIQNHVIKIIAWYDNEWSFSCRMLDLVDILIQT